MLYNLQRYAARAHISQKSIIPGIIVTVFLNNPERPNKCYLSRSEGTAEHMLARPKQSGTTTSGHRDF